jgi:hypothetical protein
MMEIELKRIAYNPRLDEQAFAANLIIDGQKVAQVIGKNGIVQVLPNSSDAVGVLAKAEDFIKDKKVLKFSGGEYTSVTMDLNGYVNTLFEQYLRNKELQKFTKRVELLQKKNIVIGVEGKYTRNQSLQIPLDVLLQTESGITMLKDILTNKVNPSLSTGEKVLNTNIPVAILEQAGLNPEQYLVRNKETKAKITRKKDYGKRL